ncbi:MAG: hypothetical protein U1F76_01415 [Candidatus Competibacteraceae bacterium]
MTTAHEVAKQGGPHKGLLRRYANDPDHLIAKAIKTYEKRIAEHRSWIAKPMLKVRPDITEKEINYLITRKWPDDVHRLVQERDVLMGIIEERRRAQST